MISSEALVLTLPYPKAPGDSLLSRLCLAFPPQQACFHMLSSLLIGISLLGLSPLILGTAGLFEVAPSTENLCNVCTPESLSFPSKRKTASGLPIYLGLPGSSDSKEYMQFRRPGFHPWGWEDPLEKRMATHSSVLAWRIPWTEKPRGLCGVSVWGCKEPNTSEQVTLSQSICPFCRRLHSPASFVVGCDWKCCLQRPDLGHEARNLPLYSFPFLSFLGETRIPAGSLTCTGPFVALFDN